MANTEKPRRNPGTVCPLHRKDVSKVCHTCDWYTRLIGKHPQTNEQIDEWGCAIFFMPMLQIESSQQMRQAGASADKVATEVQRFHKSMADMNSLALVMQREMKQLPGRDDS